MVGTELLFSGDSWSIELNRSNAKSSGLVYTFTPFNFQNLSEPGFGVSYLTQRGFDVVSFKCVDNSWYQNIDRAVLNEVSKIGKMYEHVASYGSSMGAYAAIAFSRILNPQIILAVSPQFAIDQEFDRRWAKFSQQKWIYRISEKDIGEGKFVLIYDSRFSLDVLHIDRIKSVVEAQQIVEYPIPFSGHASSAYLLESGQLQPNIARLLRGDFSVEFSNSWAVSKKSKTFFMFLGRYAESHGRFRLAEMCYRRSIELAADHAETWFLLSRLLKNLGRLDAAYESAKQAVRLAPKIDGFKSNLQEISKLLGALSSDPNK